ncbi:MAG: hypothetical protein GX059_03110 [Clostridiales bacterium]|nr:hypothetical protein [Clostridiales bacterium]
MLGKLIKHEFNATARIFLPLYLIMLLLSLINRVMFSIDNLSKPLKTIRNFSIAMYVLSILAAIVVTFVIMILRFYRNLLSDEGYLMFTLPVKPSQHIISKLIVSMIWNIGTLAVVALSLLAMLGTRDNLESLKEILDGLLYGLRLGFGDKYGLVIAEYAILLLVGTVMQILMIYASIAIGHLFTEHRVIGSFAAYIGINTIVQMISTIIMLIWTNIELSMLNYSPYYSELNEWESSISILEAVPSKVFPFSIIFTIILSVVYYIVTNYIFKKKLNLN